jgi:hypothetical protein
MASMLTSFLSGGASDDLEEIARVRAPPVPVEMVRRVAAICLAECKNNTSLQKVEAYLGRNGMSLYSGKTSFYDILMNVFPQGKPIKVSRAAFANDAEAQQAYLFLAWAATCERWASEYNSLQSLFSPQAAQSQFAKVRGRDLIDAMGVMKNPFDSFAKQKVLADDVTAAKAVAITATAEPVVRLTQQILFMKPLIWHKEMNNLASYADPAVTADSSEPPEWLGVYKQLIATDDGKSTGRAHAAIGKQVYVDGVAMPAYEFFLTAVKQLDQEADELFPAAGSTKHRRGACPIGQEYIVKYHGVVVPRGALDVAIRNALRKFGPIDGVTVECRFPAVTFTAIPVDGADVW